MEWALPHPDDPSRLVRIEDLLAEMRAEAQADHAAALSRLDAQGASLAALGGRVTKLESDTRVAELQKQVTDLAARVKALEAQTGPAFGVDVSGHQTLAEVQAATADPVNGFVIVKATEGMSGKNDDYAAQRAAAGVKFVGAYHFAWLNQDPLKEAANFLSTAALKPGEVAFLDVENWGTGERPTPEMLATSWSQRLAFTLTWLDEVKAKTGTTPAVYANWDWIKNLRSAASATQWDRLVKYPLWLAEWTLVAGKHSTVTSKDGTSQDSWPIIVHQYGVVDSLDRNWTPDIARLRALA